MKLICIRHTKVAVPAGICYGQTDVPLAESYPAEQLAVLQQLPEGKFDAVFSSPLQRCRLLAEDLFAANEIIFDDRLKELDFGDWENRSWDVIFQTDGGKQWMENYLEISCPNGESYLEFRKRIISFLDELKTRSITRAIIITHGGVIRLIKSILGDQMMDDVFATFNPEYGGIYEFEL